MKIVWTKKGVESLANVLNYFADYNGEARANVFNQELIQYLNEKLPPYPERFPPCRQEKLREYGCRCINYLKKYIVIYTVAEEEIIILGIVSNKRNPKSFEKLLGE